VNLNMVEQEYVTLQWTLLRQANKKAAEFSREWNARNAEVEDKGARAGWTDYRLRTEKEADLVLKDLFAGWDFWQREARRIHCAIDGEYTARILLGMD
jgi:hypothetical protein